MNTTKQEKNTEKNAVVAEYNSEIAKRLKSICNNLEGGADELSEIADIPRRTLGNYLSGRNEPKPSVCLRICSATSANIAWLISGEGQNQPDHVKEEKNGYKVNLNKNNDINKEEREQFFQEKKTEFGKKMHDYKDATIETGYAPPILIREAIKTVMFTQGLTKPGAIIILNAMKEQENIDNE